MTIGFSCGGPLTPALTLTLTITITLTLTVGIDFVAGATPIEYYFFQP
jgi:hypothetical protein